MNWETGHWLTGRLGSTPLDGLVSKILMDCDITGIDCSELGEGADGYVVDRPMAPRAMLDPLALAFAFDAFEQDGLLRFRQRGGAPAIELTEDDLVLPDDSPPARLIRAQDIDLPREVTIGFTDVGADYQRGAAASRRLGRWLDAAARTPILPLSRTTRRRSGAPRSGCRICGPDATARISFFRRADSRLRLATWPA